MPKQFRNANSEWSGSSRSGPQRIARGFRVPGSGFRVSVLAALLVGGCVSKETAREQARQAYEAGLRQGEKVAELKRTSVFLKGAVQKQVIPWRKGLTLAQAIVESVYTSPQDPIAISITRNGRIIPFDPGDLLKGIDFPLEAGDTVDIR
jgi:hypothetical protein